MHYLEIDLYRIRSGFAPFRKLNTVGSETVA
jgi:hypothetical protein